MAAIATFTNTPTAVSNTYNGTITLQIGGLTNGETVVVQKFLDLNTNGVVDPTDYLVQQFRLTDGQASVFTNGATLVTNFNVPGDTDGTSNGQITAVLNFRNGDFVQNTIGKFLYVLSSPVGHFSPVTNSFVVTNFPYAQSIGGTVISNGISATPVTNAVVLLFNPPSPGGDLGSPVGGTVANNSGAYSIAMPAGSYLMFAIKSNYVANVSSPTVVTLGSSSISTNLSLTKATATISGTFVDANNHSIVLPGVFAPVSANGLIAVAFTDTNGNFTARVTTGSYDVGSDSGGLVIHGYVGYEEPPTNVNAGKTGMIVPFSKATALLYGSVLDNFGNPLQGIDLSITDSSNLYQMDYYSVSNGNYAAGILANGEAWQLQVGNGFNPLSTNYVFSTASAAQNGGVTLSFGQAVQANISAILAAYQITGHVQDNFGNPIAGVSMAASATIDDTNYFPLEVETDTNGNYVFNVPGASWTVSVSDDCDNDNGNEMLSTNYECPNSQLVIVSDTNGVANFTVQTNANSGGSLVVTTLSLSNGVIGVYYDQQLNAEGGSPPQPGGYSWSLYSGSLPDGLNLQSGGFITGTPTSPGMSSFTVQVDDQNGDTTTKGLSLTISSGVLQVTTTSLPFGVTNFSYSQQLTASGGQPFPSGNYSWTNLTGKLPPGLSLATNGVISGTPTVLGTSNITFRVTDSLSATATQALSLAIVPQITGVAFIVTPATVSNTYGGMLTLSVTGAGLVAGETVTVQKYLDANTNGVIDGGDALVQQFNLTDGQASLFTNGATVVTNLNVPGDLNPAAGAITAQAYFNSTFNGQDIGGQYLYKLSSPIGHFAPLTNSFSVTNFPFGQSFSGVVVSNATSVPLTNAIVLLGQPSPGGGLNVEYGTVANNSGNYTISVPAGNYLLFGIKSNYVSNVGGPTLTLTNGTTFVTNVSLLLATQTISGVINNLNNTNVGLPGLLTIQESTNDLIGGGFTSSNGNFSAGVTASQWKLEGDDEGYAMLGYLRLQNNPKINTSTGSVAGVTVSVPQFTALFYGRVQDPLGHPLAGVGIYASDNNNLYESDVNTDTNGDYYSGALAGETWQIDTDTQQSPANSDYVYSQAQFGEDGGTNLVAGQAVQVNFTALLATNYLTGRVQDNFGNAIVGVGVYATAVINSVNYSQGNVDTDNNGNYSMNVANGSWTVSVNDSCQGGGNDSLSSNYQCPNSQTVTISNSNGVANFTVQTNINSGGLLQVTTTSLSNGVVGTVYDQQLNADGGFPPQPGDYNWSLSSGSFPAGLTLQSGGFITGTPTGSGTSNFTMQVSDQNGNTATKALSLTISGSGQPVLGTVKFSAGGKFQIQLDGTLGQSFTLQMTTNLLLNNWTSILQTNAPNGPFFLTDTNATNIQRFYRILSAP